MSNIGILGLLPQPPDLSFAKRAGKPIELALVICTINTELVPAVGVSPVVRSLKVVLIFTNGFDVFLLDGHHIVLLSVVPGLLPAVLTV
jgi:hypothetical protein